LDLHHFQGLAERGSIRRSKPRSVVAQIDPNPRTNQIAARIRLGDTVMLSAGGGYLWVINRETRSVVRVRPAD
jgi:hypothetical protein